MKARCCIIRFSNYSRVRIERHEGECWTLPKKIDMAMILCIVLLARTSIIAYQP